MEEILRGVLQRHKDCGFMDIGINYLSAILDEFTEKTISCEICDTLNPIDKYCICRITINGDFIPLEKRITNCPSCGKRLRGGSND